MLNKSTKLLLNYPKYKNAFIYSINSRFIHLSRSRKAVFNVQDEDDFEERVIKSATPVIVDFHAQWCGPCGILTPRLLNVINGKGERVHLAKIDIDNVADLALDYGVTAVPSVLAIKEGKVVDKFVGLQDEARIESFINKLLIE